DRLLGSASQYYFFDQGVQLAQSGSWQQTLYMVDGARPTHVTLVWTDSSGAVQAQYSVKNNLDLLACANSGFTCWYSNTFNNLGYSTPNYPNHDGVNNVEQIIIAPNNLSAGSPIYLSISAASIPIGYQDFA